MFTQFDRSVLCADVSTAVSRGFVLRLIFARCIYQMGFVCNVRRHGVSTGPPGEVGGGGCAPWGAVDVVD